jgi:uncharacterized membrane protein YfcA
LYDAHARLDVTSAAHFAVSYCSLGPAQASKFIGSLDSGMTLVLVAAGTLLAACVQATGGIGFALILTPVLFALLPAVGAIVVATGLGLLLNALVLFAEHRRPTVAWKEVAPILIAAAPGTVVGLLVLRALPKPVLQVAVGVAVIGFGLVVLRGRVRVPAGQGWVRVPLGFTTGVLTTSTGVNGPPVALWLSSRGLGAHAVRDSLGAMFLALGTIAALTLLPVLHEAHLGAWTLIAAVLAVLAGHAIGSRLFARLTPGHFEVLLLAITLATGATSVVLGLTSL